MHGEVAGRLYMEIHSYLVSVIYFYVNIICSIIAVNYPARDRGVTRHMRGNEAKKNCPEIELVRVPNVRGKADLTKYEIPADSN